MTSRIEGTEPERQRRIRNRSSLALRLRFPLAQRRSSLLGARALQKVADSSLNEYRKLLLNGLIEEYLRLDDEEKRRLFAETLNREEFKGANQMNLTSFQKGQIEVLEQLKQDLLERLRTKFGPLPESTEAKVRELSAKRLSETIFQFGAAQSLADLKLI